MKSILDNIILPLLLLFILGAFKSWLQIRENKSKIETLFSRLEKLENVASTFPDFYVTRREFNKILELQNGKMDTINRNVEKLIDLQLKNR